MAKKKRAAKSAVKATPPKTAARNRAKRLPGDNDRPAARQPSPLAVHCYRHEVGSNTNHGPLIIEIDISVGRGLRPRTPGFVGFTAEIADDGWPDQFAFRIVSLEERRVRVAITRVDRGQQELSWGANLVVHALVVDR